MLDQDNEHSDINITYFRYIVNALRGNLTSSN